MSDVCTVLASLTDHCGSTFCLHLENFKDDPEMLKINCNLYDPSGKLTHQNLGHMAENCEG